MHSSQWTCCSIITVYKTLRWVLNLLHLLRHLKKYMVIILWTEFLNEDIIKRVSQDPLFTTPSLIGLLELILGLLDLLVHLRLHLLRHLRLRHLRLHLLRILRLHLHLRLPRLHLLRRQLRWRPYDH